MDDLNFSEPRAQDMSIGEWLITLLILCVPCLNLIMLFVWGFGDTKNTNPSKSNFAKAYLIFVAICTVLGIVCYSALFSMLMNIAGQMR